MDRIELNSEGIERIINQLDEEGRRVFEKLLLVVASKSPIEAIETWLGRFEADCPVDNLVARLVVQVINNVGGKIWEAMEKHKEAGNEHYTGHQASLIAIAEIRSIADVFEHHVSGECSKERKEH